VQPSNATTSTREQTFQTFYHHVSDWHEIHGRCLPRISGPGGSPWYLRRSSGETYRSKPNAAEIAITQRADIFSGFGARHRG